MELSLIIYLVGILDTLCSALGLISGFTIVLSAVAFFVYILMRCMEGSDESFNNAMGTTVGNIKLVKKTSIILLLIAMTTMVSSIFLPSSKTLAAMYVIPKIANNEDIQKLGDGLMKKALSWANETTGVEEPSE